MEIHTGSWVSLERGFIHLCMPHLSVPIVCISWEDVCRWTGGGARSSVVGNFHYHHARTTTMKAYVADVLLR